MARELVALAPREPIIREYTEPRLAPGLVRIQTEFGAPKHGTEMGLYRNEAPGSRHYYDAAWQCFFPREKPGALFPMALGNMCVGTVTAVGEGVSTVTVGDRVFGHLPLRDVHVVPEQRVRKMPEGLSDQAAVCLDPADAALAMRDAHVRVGDRVAVFGLGAIGLFAVQYCRLSGADLIVAVDPVKARRDLAGRFGADVLLDPGSCDAGFELRQITARLGVDVALEVSGNAAALHQAIRGTRYGGTVGVISVLQPGFALDLGQEFHHNRITLVSARTVSRPFFETSGWDHQRVEELALRWLTSGKLTADGIVHPIVPFEACAEAYRRIDQHPEESVKLGVSFAS